MNPIFLFANAFEYKSERGKYYVIGYLSTPDIDLVNDMVTKECLRDMLSQIKTMNISASLKANIEHEHVFTDPRIVPVGKVVDAGLDGKGLWVKVQLNDSLPEFKAIWKSIREGYLDAFSIEYRPVDYEYKVVNGKEVRVLKKIKLLGLAFTGRPANPEAKIVNAFVKSIQGDVMENQEDVKKKITNFEEVRKKLGMSVEEFYAIPRDPPSASKLPIFDAAHVRNAIARFNQVEGVTPEEKKKAWQKILRAAKKFGIEVSKEKKKEESKSEEKVEDTKEEKAEVKEEPKPVEKTEEKPVEKEEEKPKEEPEKKEDEPKEEPKEETKEEPSDNKEAEIKSLKEEIEKLKNELAEVKARTEDQKLLENVKSIILEEIKNLEPEKKPLVKDEVKFKDEKVDVKNMSVGEVAQKILFRG